MCLSQPTPHPTNCTCPACVHCATCDGDRVVACVCTSIEGCDLCDFDGGAIPCPACEPMDWIMDTAKLEAPPSQDAIDLEYRTRKLMRDVGLDYNAARTACEQESRQDSVSL